MRNREALVELALFALALACALFGYGLPRFGRDAYTPREREPGELRIVTWNVGGAAGRSGSPLREEHLPEVAETLRELDADLVLLQELASLGQLGRLQQRLGDSVRDSAMSDRGARRVAVFARRGVLTPLDTPRLEGGRALGFRCDLPGGRPLVGIVLHASAWSSQERNREIGEAALWLAAEGRDVARFLAGDLNLDLDLDKRRDLFTDDEYLLSLIHI